MWPAERHVRTETVPVRRGVLVRRRRTTAGNLPVASGLFYSSVPLFVPDRMRVAPLKLALFAAVYFVSMMGLWVLYTSTVRFWELIFGGGAAILATIAAAVVEEQRFAQFAPDPKWLLYFITLPWSVLRDTALVYRAAVKYALNQKSDGYLISVDFESGGDDARSSARRALATALATIPPNSIVVGIDRKQNKVLLHMLTPDDIPSTLTRLGAQP
jgi:multisubunit Na+/H+ antiporter MnhE subunit